MKSVIVFVQRLEDDEYRYFTESTEFGIDCKYPSAASFVKQLQKMYNDHGNNNFIITNVVIG